MKRVLFLGPLVLLAACEPMIRDSDVVRYAADPAFVYSESGRIIPTSCRGNSTYSSRASACQRDLVFAQQVTNPSDLVVPRKPGPARAYPVGRAADRYLYGQNPGGGSGGGGGERSQGRTITPGLGGGNASSGPTPNDPYNLIPEI
ncbi:hypothetical protein [Paracoccus sp. (in: a-proteobacteria)]|uniref:hypothetical protein n=1 Tax=Paracoccus sp. TaxID=267 RepID=UPI003A89DCF5